MELMTVAFPDPDERICELSSTSDPFYAGLMTQIHEKHLDHSMENQDH
jgi:hypothetical protein